MWAFSHFSMLFIICTIPRAICAPAATSATTTLLSTTRISSATFPIQTSSTTHFSSVDLPEESESIAPASTLSTIGSDRTITDFVPAPTGANGNAERWYIVTYYSCVTFSEDDVHCGYHTPVRPGVGPDGSYFDAGERIEVWFVGLAVGVAVALLGPIIM